MKKVFARLSGTILFLLVVTISILFLSGQIYREELSGVIKDMETSDLQAEAKKIIQGLRYVRDPVSDSCLMVVFRPNKETQVVGVCPCDSIPPRLVIEVDDKR